MLAYYACFASNAVGARGAAAAARGGDGGGEVCTEAKRGRPSGTRVDGCMLCLPSPPLTPTPPPWGPPDTPPTPHPRPRQVPCLEPLVADGALAEVKVRGRVLLGNLRHQQHHAQGTAAWWRGRGRKTGMHARQGRAARRVGFLDGGGGERIAGRAGTMQVVTCIIPGVRALSVASVTEVTEAAAPPTTLRRAAGGDRRWSHAQVLNGGALHVCSCMPMHAWCAAAHASGGPHPLLHVCPPSAQPSERRGASSNLAKPMHGMWRRWRWLEYRRLIACSHAVMHAWRPPWCQCHHAPAVAGAACP